MNGNPVMKLFFVMVVIFVFIKFVMVWKHCQLTNGFVLAVYIAILKLYLNVFFVQFKAVLWNLRVILNPGHTLYAHYGFRKCVLLILIEENLFHMLVKCPLNDGKQSKFCAFKLNFFLGVFYVTQTLEHAFNAHILIVK